MRFIKAIAAAAALFLTTSPAMAHDFGPPVGAHVPEALSARDQNGAEKNFASLVGENGLVLLMTRSADWCPYCQRQLIGLEGVRAEIEARGWKLAAVTTDTVEELDRFVKVRGIGYPILSDDGSVIVDAFELRDPNYEEGSYAYGVPVPTLFFFTPDGVIRERLGERDYRVRPAPEQALAAIDRINAQ